MNRFICIHGHFYQPSRENPWLEEVELQASAHPYHDWNKRITSECYAANTASPIIGPDRKIIETVCNYSKISFNFGPTLLSWMERHEPSTYMSIIEADKTSVKRFSGHGSAIAQVYNHMIMPLASRRDKYTQVIWGIADFQKRFKRFPEGMWLPETAVDLETLEILAEHGIKFTILTPKQAAAFKKIGDKDWVKTNVIELDTRRPYLYRLPSGKTMNLYFYDSNIANQVAFGGLLLNGAEFARRLVAAFTSETDSAELVSIATDGETYGHHHKFGDMALAYCLRFLESHNLARLTNYGEFLEKFPPTYEVMIIENTSWSCIHGVERWRGNCGCKTGKMNWNQEWRQSLREAMNWLTSKLVNIYAGELSKYLRDPWRARDEYIAVVLDRSKLRIEQFFAKHASKGLSQKEKVIILKLLEMQRHSMLMHASCGWFFDDISGIETVQIMTHAERAMRLVEEIIGINLELEYVKILAKASSNIPEFENGAKVFERFAKPAYVDLLKVGAHHIISSMVDGSSKSSKIYCYGTKYEFYETLQSGRMRLAMGVSRIKSEITWEEEVIIFAALWLGDHNIVAGAKRFTDDISFSFINKEIKSSFQGGNERETMKLIDKYFGMNTYSLDNLFEDERRKIVNKIS